MYLMKIVNCSEIDYEITIDTYVYNMVSPVPGKYENAMMLSSAKSKAR